VLVDKSADRCTLIPAGGLFDNLISVTHVIVIMPRLYMCTKLFQNYFTGLLQLTNILQRVQCRWNNFEIISEHRQTPSTKSRFVVCQFVDYRSNSNLDKTVKKDQTWKIQNAIGLRECANAVVTKYLVNVLFLQFTANSLIVPFHMKSFSLWPHWPLFRVSFYPVPSTDCVYTVPAKWQH